MKFKKGQSGNYNGRPVGAIDKDKRKIRDIINTAIEDNASLYRSCFFKSRGVKVFLFVSPPIFGLAIVPYPFYLEFYIIKILFNYEKDL